ncbi:MAG: trehalose-6-phosphate synthase [Pseudolabrys sp.]
MSVVVISNRVARISAAEPIMGGLASALLPAVKGFGAVWIGSSGKVQKPQDRDAFASVEALGKGALATVDLPEAHYANYYEGYSNSALWPVLHSRLDLLKCDNEHYASYREINRYMARAVLRFAKPDSIFWVQDYHFLCMAEEMRKLRIREPIGFFLHTPWPERGTFMALPQHRELVTALLAYDLIGFQTADDVHNFTSYVEIELGIPCIDGVFQTKRGTCRVGAFPIGIDADEFADLARQSSDHAQVHRLMQSLQGRKLLIGVDRVDYSKGLLNRFQTFDRMLTHHPRLKRRVSLLQIAVPSRSNIDSYCNLQDQLAHQVGLVNGRHGEVDWTPIRYLNKGYGQPILAGFYRAAAIGLVTPFHDGMNLVAKEYVAAQDPGDPGVLVLSEFAGAARELDAAVLVNPHDIDGMAEKLAGALAMPHAERRERWTSLMAAVRKSSIHAWFSDFLTTLERAAPQRAPSVLDDFSDKGIPAAY